jgi:DNA invertase Pin-like site-specific DNA recombinase
MSTAKGGGRRDYGFRLCPRQYARENRIQILEHFQDSSSAYNDEDRPGFDRMLNEAIQKRPKFILVDDSSRFARTRRHASTVTFMLQEHGVQLIAVSEPVVDPNSVQGVWLNGIMETKNEAASREIAFHTVRGMQGNIKARDPETGWCYKNGGRTPYGYRAVRVNRGQDSKGKPIIETIWELDPKTAPIAKMGLTRFRGQPYTWGVEKSREGGVNAEKPSPVSRRVPGPGC